MDTSDHFAVFPIPIFNVRIFLIPSKAGFILVDTGIPFMEERVFHALDGRGVKLQDIKLILLTHGHLDHIGCLAYLKNVTGAGVVCHQSIADDLSNGSYEKAVPRKGLWKILNDPISQILSRGLKPIEPDYTFENTFDLSELGFQGKMIHTPGHSPGSASVILDGGICLIGDLLRETKPGVYDTGLFYNDRNLIITSLLRIAAHQPETIYLSHGTTMKGAALENFLEKNR
jgi:glyoxylase-like metal-dependent hydrolase (beta-lactamase superfamily II)